MNCLQRVSVRIASAICPPLRHLLREAGGTIERLSEERALMRAVHQDAAMESRMLAAELREAAAMAGPGPWLGPVASGSSGALRPLRESIAELELALEDRGWRNLLGRSAIEFSRWGIQQIILLARLYRIKNPLIQRGILVSAYYVFGRGVEVTSSDEAAREVLREFFSDPRNRKAIGVQGLIDREAELYTDGNIFWCLFTAPDDGRCVIRTIDPLEIQDIVCDPDDSDSPRYYRRCWASQEFDSATGVTSIVTREAWYVALGYDPPDGMREIGGIPIMLDAAANYVRVHHRKDGGLPKWRYGCPRAYAALDWARAYKGRLEDYATIVRMLSRFSFEAETKGGAPAIAALKQGLATTLASDSWRADDNPAPVAGSAFISGPGTKLRAIDTAGKTPPPEEGRRLAHMVYMVFGLPETFFSDVSVGTLATATSLDRPTELRFLTHQEAWAEDLTVLSRYVLDASARAPRGRLREARTIAQDVDVRVVFPPILEGDIPAEIRSIVEAMTLGTGSIAGIDEKTGVRELLRALGVADIETVLEAMYPEAEYDPSRVKPENEPPATAREAAVLAAVRELRSALVKFREAA